MLFSTSIILPIALLCHTAASLSVPEPLGVNSLTRRGTQKEPTKKDPSQYTKDAVKKIQDKAKEISKHVHEDRAQVLIASDLKFVIKAFKSFVDGMNDCNCTEKGSVDLDGYKDLVLQVMGNVQVVVELIVGTQDKTLIKSAQDIFSNFTVHVAKLVDVVIKVDVKIAVTVRDNVNVDAYTTIGVDMIELVNGKISKELSGEAAGKPVVKEYRKGNLTGQAPVDPTNPYGNNTGSGHGHH